MRDSLETKAGWEDMIRPVLSVTDADITVNGSGTWTLTIAWKRSNMAVSVSATEATPEKAIASARQRFDAFRAA